MRMRTPWLTAAVTVLLFILATPACAVDDVEGALGLREWRRLAHAAKPPKVQWTKAYRASSSGNCVVQTRDGGFVAVGATAPDTGGSSRYYMVKTDSLGNVEWQRKGDWTLKSDAKSVIQTLDGGYALAGYALAPGRAYGVYLAKYGTLGNLTWHAVLSTTALQAYSVLQTEDGGYAVATNGLAGGQLLKTDSLGTLLWSKTFCPSWYTTQSIPMQRTKDGGFIIGASTLIKLDSVGNLLWSKTYDSVIAVYSVLQTPDGGYAATGVVRQGESARPLSMGYSTPRVSMYLLKTDSQGNLTWKKNYQDTLRSSVGFWVELAGEVGLHGFGLVATGSESSPERYAGYVVKTNASGEERWRMTTAPPPQCLRRTSDGGYILVGSSHGLVLTKLAPERGR
ncbi:hypothetical protein JXD38_12285 [candidate division WOR-3 bacterium]|nr:hypothetical protein [candidate division WOR-3 bacterium]